MAKNKEEVFNWLRIYVPSQEKLSETYSVQPKV